MNRIALENQIGGAPRSEWDLNGDDNGTIEGFATEISVNAGETIAFKVRTVASRYRLDIYRLGYYEGLGARLCVPIYNALDPSTHHPVAPDARFAADLGFLGNRLPDREARVEEFFQLDRGHLADLLFRVVHPALLADARADLLHDGLDVHRIGADIEVGHGQSGR